MIDRNIVVPEDMLKATDNMNFHFQRDERKRLIEAALHWLSEHPIVPTTVQCMQIYDTVRGSPVRGGGTWDESRECYAEWQRRMFRELEPEVPEAIKDLLWDESIDKMCARSRANADIIEAYRRGQQSKESR